jgi:hypothetical protein
MLQSMLQSMLQTMQTKTLLSRFDKIITFKDGNHEIDKILEDSNKNINVKNLKKYSKYIKKIDIFLVFIIFLNFYYIFFHIGF